MLLLEKFDCVKCFVERYRLAFESLLVSALAAISSSNVQELDISVIMDKTVERFSVSIPPAIFTCKTLVTLSLDLGVDWVVPNLVSLPNLKVIHLDELGLADEDSIQKFLHGCPLLEKIDVILMAF